MTIAETTIASNTDSISTLTTSMTDAEANILSL